MTTDPRSRDEERTLTISVVVPVYNSASMLPLLVQRVEAVLGSLTPEFELILVNDGSRDDSWATIVSLAKQYAFVVGINLMRNYGQHNALLCGIRAAHHPITITMDDDLQNPPEEIPRLLAEIVAGADVVYGAPQQEQHGLLRDTASRITKLVLQRTMGAETARNISAFRAFRTPLRESFAGFNGPLPSIDVLLTWGTSRFAAIRVEHARRQVGVSNYNVWKLLTHAFNMVTGFSTWPLRAASAVGFGFTLFGLCALAFVIGRFILFGSSVPGFPFLASIITIFSGAQLFALGIIGEYLARMHLRLMDRPAYVVQSSIGEMRCADGSESSV